MAAGLVPVGSKVGHLNKIRILKREIKLKNISVRKITDIIMQKMRTVNAGT
jgi:hypothetical protein